MQYTRVKFCSDLFNVPCDEKQFNSDLVSQLELTLFDCVNAVMVDHESRYYFDDSAFRDKICFTRGSNLPTSNK